jgi:hypothetical protein
MRMCGWKRGREREKEREREREVGGESDYKQFERPK